MLADEPKSRHEKAGFAAWPAWAAVAIAAGLLFSRTLRIDLAPFIQDEPQFLRAARMQLETGHWASHSPLTGSSVILYGPTPLWFYGIVEAVLGPAAPRSILVVALVVSLAELAFVVALFRAFPRRSPWLLAVLLAFVAAAPFEIFWSRLAWDLSANVVPFLAVALLVLPALTPARAVALGVLAGLGFSAHPMTLPFIAIAFVVVARSLAPGRERVRSAGLALAGFLVPNLPWFAYLASQPWFERVRELQSRAQGAGEPANSLPTASHSIDWAAEAGRWLSTFRPHTIHGFSYYFDADWQAFATEHPWLTSPAIQAGSLVLAAVVSVAGLMLLRRSEHPGLRRVGTIGFACAVGYPAYYTLLRLGPHPHYQFPVAWLAVAGAAGCLFASGRWRWAGLTAVTVLALVDVGFDAAWTSFVAERSGTRGIHYGTPVGDQQAFVSSLCAMPEKDLLVMNRTAMFEYPFYQHFEANPACRAHSLVVCPGARCAGSAPGARVVELEYAGAQGGALRWSAGAVARDADP